MGGFVSNLRKKENDEEEEKIRKYEEQIENNPYGYGFGGTLLFHIKIPYRTSL
jgi:hypothetical protein